MTDTWHHDPDEARRTLDNRRRQLAIFEERLEDDNPILANARRMVNEAEAWVEKHREEDR